MLVLELDGWSMMADASPLRAAAYRSSAEGVTDGVVWGPLWSVDLVGVVNWTLAASLLAKSTRAFSLEARTVSVTVRYNGSFGVRKLTAIVKCLTVFASG